jgi:nucleoid DNA-binding protein
MVLNINNHINNLLCHHDCVIVSGLGAFILNQNPASINQKTGKIEPPKKSVSFNSNIKQNDGLLANHIAKRNELSYEEACLEIARFSKTIIFKIKNNEKVILESLGALSLRSGKIIFSPNEKNNYDKNSFGLKSFYFPKRKKKIYSLYQRELRVAATLIGFIGLSFFFFSKYNSSENTNLSNVSSFINEYDNTKNNIKTDTLFEKAGLYNLQVSQVDYDLYNINGTNYHINTKKCFKLGFGINAQIKIYDQGKKRKREICFSNIYGTEYTDCYSVKNVYSKVETSSDKLVVIDKKGRMRTAVLVFEETILDYNTLLNSNPQELEIDNADLTSRFINAVNSLSDNNETEELDQVIFNPIEEEIINTIDSHSKETGFFIIVGSFSTKQNAQKLVNQLIKKGFKTASLAGQSSNNLFRVSCYRYETEKIAKKELEKLKSEFKGAWVLAQHSR